LKDTEQASNPQMFKKYNVSEVPSQTDFNRHLMHCGKGSKVCREKLLELMKNTERAANSKQNLSKLVKSIYTEN
jgi:hypothetical protein